MKNNRFTARRILQGGAAFAALGALSIATALPAAADTQVVGWAYAEVAGAELGIAATPITPQGESSSSSGGGSFELDDYFSIDATTSASVGASGATATTTVNSARLVLTESDVEEEEDQAEEGNGDGGDPSPSPSADESDEDDDTDGDESGGDDTDGDGDSSTEGDGDGNTEGETGGEGDSSTDGDEFGGDDTDDESGTDDQEPTPTSSPDTQVTTLDEENSETVANGDEIVLDVTISGASVTTTQSWSGDVSHSYEAGTVFYAVNELDADLSRAFIGEDDKGTYEVEDAGFVWNDAFTGLRVTVMVPEHFETGYVLGASYAGIGAEPTNGADNGGDNGDGADKGDDKNPPNRDEDKLPKPEPKATESLARTGSPVGGLIAAGAAIAAGGGAAAYFARRKKNTVDSAAETSEG